MEWVYVIAAIASSIAAVLAWAAKLWWGKEYGAAKDETIKAKNAQIEVLKKQIENLRELTPMKIREYFLSVKEQLEEYNESLKGQLVKAKTEIEQKDKQIIKLHGEGDKQKTELEILEREKKILNEKTKVLELETSHFESFSARTIKLLEIDVLPSVIESIFSEKKPIANFNINDYKIQRGIPKEDEPCPCRSGKKYKECHGIT